MPSIDETNSNRKIYRIKLFVNGRSAWRIIDIREDQSLNDLHEEIQHAIEWDNDHLYAFYFKPTPETIAIFREHRKKMYKETEVFKEEKPEVIERWIERELQKMREIEFIDPRNDPLDDCGINAAKVKIGHLELEIKTRFTYLFDFGDNNRFTCTVIGIHNNQSGEYPKIVESMGKAPQQYLRA